MAEEKEKKKSFIQETVETVVFVVVAVMLIHFFLGEVRWIPSASMRPTLLEGDRIIVENFSRFYRSPQRGDIMIFYPPDVNLKYDPLSLFRRLTGFFCADKAYIKRVIGLPGEKIEIVRNEDGSNDVFINDKILIEPYILDKYYTRPCTEDMFCGPMVLGDDEYFMMGDNRGNSQDSRYWGALKKKRFIGRAKVLFWPFKRLQYFKIQTY